MGTQEIPRDIHQDLTTEGGGLQVSEKLVPVRATGLVPAAREPVEVAGTGSGWAVLQDDIVGVAGTGTKLKDWDKVVESEDDDDMAGEREGVSSSGEEAEW